MNYLSVCSGIEAATCAWHPLGWSPVAFSEIEAFPSAVLAHHYPETPNWGDMTKFKEWPDANVDVLVGGTPCQSFSVAGLRKGLDDPRGNLMLTFGAITAKYRPEWLVWENVPGVLSSNGGRDFGAFLGMLGELGYGFAYRILDAQYAGLAQRRRRVFVVANLGDWRCAAAVLFERHSLQGHPAPSREKGQRVAPTIGTGAPFSRTGNGSELGALIAPEISNALCARDYKGARPEADQGAPLLAVSFGWQNSPSQGDSVSSHVAPTLDKSKTPAVSLEPYTLAIRGRGDSHNLKYRQDGTANALLTPNGGRGGIGVGAVAFAQNQRDEVRTMEVAGALSAEPGAKQQTYAHVGMQVRRLTPVECERLQGFTDNYTQIPYRNKPADKCPDGPRYKALGNSMAVPVMAWIGQRIQMVSEIASAEDAA